MPRTTRNPARRATRALLLSGLLSAALAASVHAAAPRPALSTTPTPVVWDIPALIPVYGYDAVGVADPRGEFVITIRDLAMNPVPGALVVLDFSNCADLRLCVDPHDADAVVDCDTRTLRKVTGLNGQVRFRVVGCSVAAPGSAGASTPCARVYADGVLGGSAAVAIYDLIGCDGLAPADASAWLTDLFGGLDPLRGDYDGSGALGPADLGLWLNAFFADGSLANCSSGGRCGP